MTSDGDALAAAFAAGATDELAAELGFTPILPAAPPPPHDLAALARDARHAASPELAFGRALDVASQLDDAPASWDVMGRRALVAALGASEAATRYIRAQPDIARELTHGRFVDAAKPPATFRDDLRGIRAGCRDDEEFAASLRRYRVAEWTRIIARDLADIGDVSHRLLELSILADAIVAAATAWALRRERSSNGPRVASTDSGPRPAGFSVVAQGKLGGRELNVSSDIDLQYFYSRDESPDEGLSLHERYARVARDITSIVGEVGAGGLAYRVDLDLRPEGSKGAVVNSVLAAERYYESWGRSWERLALIRARHIGGAQWVSDSFLGAVRPFVFPRSLDSSVVDETHDMITRVHAERRARAHARGRDPGFDVKRDPGGIRQVEMYVQILQLLHGGREISLRDPSIFAALANLVFVGALSRSDHEALDDAYRFWRRLENALQARDDRQTQVIPRGDERLRLAQALQLESSPALEHLVETHRSRVRQVTSRLFGEDEHETDERALALLTGDADSRPQRLEELGFPAPQEAAAVLEALSAGTGGPFSEHAKERVRRLAAPLLKEIAHAPDPNLALRQYLQLDRELRQQPHYYELLHNEPVRRRLVDLLGSSELFGRTITSHPHLVDWLAQARDRDHLGRRAGVDELVQRAAARAAQALEGDGDLELQLRSLRRLKLQECLRVGILDLADALETREVLTQLTDIAEAMVRAALALEAPAALPFVVVALGTLGAGEFGYGSDLDLIFLFEDRDDDGETRSQAVRLGQRLIRDFTLAMPEGQLYPIDTRLRPSGNQGPLVTSTAGFVDYHHNRAMLWERQAMLRARPVAGDLGLGQRLLDQLAPIRYPTQPPANGPADLRAMRQRMETELAPRRGGTNLKSGRGGLVDIEFAVQWLIMSHGHDQPQLRQTGTFPGLDALQEAGVLSAEAAGEAREAYGFLKRLEGRIRMVRDKGIDALDFEHPSAGPLARRMGYRGTDAVEALREDFDTAAGRARRFYDAVLPP